MRVEIEVVVVSYARQLPSVDDFSFFSRWVLLPTAERFDLTL